MEEYVQFIIIGIITLAFIIGLWWWDKKELQALDVGMEVRDE